MDKQENSRAEWKITRSKTAITINHRIVVADKPDAFANTIDAKETHQGHEVHLFCNLQQRDP
jgi:hypothetical protein